MKDQEKESSMFSRRKFLKTTAVATVGVAAAGLGVGCTKKAEATPTYLPAKWDYETDIVVVGYGGAGAAAAITSVQEKLGSVLVLEVAPEAEAGGNTGVCGQLIYCPENADGAVKYQKGLNGKYTVDDDLLKAWADELVKNVEWLSSIGITTKAMQVCSPEFPEVANCEVVRTYAVDGISGKRSLWNALKAQEAKLGFKVLYRTRATGLIHDPETNEVLGVVAGEAGKEKYIKAKKGVVLSCGGFENNREMVLNYYNPGVYEVYPKGTPYNRGDGFKMIEPLGADLWHMNSFATTIWHCQTAGKDIPNVDSYAFTSKDYIQVGPDGKRFVYEETQVLQRHGKVVRNGFWQPMYTPVPVFMVFGPKSFNGPTIFKDSNITGWLAQTGLFTKRPNTNQAALDAGVVLKADSLADLAKKLNVSEKALTETIANYNASCAAGVDKDFGRGTAVLDTFAGTFAGGSGGASTAEPTVVIKPFPLEPISGPPFYAFELKVPILNSQGGPKRSAKGEVLDTKGKAIPRLYAAGEFGSIYSWLYNGGGNVGEALSSGRIAVRSAAKLTAWDAKA